MTFQGLSLARNCLRPETASLTILDIKKGLLCIFAKKFIDRHFMEDGGTDFQSLLSSKSSKLTSIVLQKIC